MASVAVQTAPGPPLSNGLGDATIHEKGLPGMNGHADPSLGQSLNAPEKGSAQPVVDEKSLQSLVTPTAPTQHAPPPPQQQRSMPATAPLESQQAHAGPSKPPHLLSTHLLSHPDHTVRRAIHTQFPRPNPLMRLLTRFKIKHSVIKGMTEAEWKRFDQHADELRRKAGWKVAGAPESEEGVEVSELFWKMYMSLMPTLERDPLSGLVPPDLLGSTTTIPLTIISLIPNIMQHYHDVIIRAKEEVFLATNYWQPSNSVTTITGSLIELSNLVVKEGRQKIIVKIMYDRGSLEQLYNSHAPVPSEKWKPLDLPGADEIPGLDLEVINFHRVLLGTFHAKFLIVDRKVALINSNNIQDRPNLELMSHLEGPIVDSFYEVALHSWYNALSPQLPRMSTPYQPPRNAAGEVQYLFQEDNPFLDDIEVLKAAKSARALLRQEAQDLDAENARLRGEDAPAADRLREAVRRVMDHQRQNLAEWRPGERFDEAMTEFREMRERWTGSVAAQGGKSRPGSRGPSRRGSANEGMFRALLKGGDKPSAGDYTIAHAPLTAPDPSEAPSSPTISETPIRSKTYPQAAHAEDPERHSPAEEVDLGSKRRSMPHVAFAPLTTDVDGSGRITGLSEQAPAKSKTDRPGSLELSVPGSRFVERVSSPSPISQTAPSPLPPRAPSGSPAQSMPLSLPMAPVAIDGLPTSSQAEGMAARSRHDAPPSHLENGDVSRDDADRATIKDESQGVVLETTESVIPEGRGSSRRLYKMSKMFNAAGVLSEAWATVEDSDELDTFQPHVVHAPHKPVPVAMACRKPHGFPGHHDIRNPQNAAWLAGFRYAKKRVFVQTPTLNARPIVRAVKQACRRGVSVELLLDLGFNDKGESIPFQGGTNEEVVVRLYKALRKEKKEQHLKVYWYTGKDQVRPLNAVKKQRNCHIKFAAYDDEVLIIGNGNQDSQSWFHSQEVNVMVDSKQIIKEMMDTLLTNQNTIQYGLVDTDGIWRDKEGKTLKDYGATEGGRFRGLSGFIAFAKTI